VQYSLFRHAGCNGCGCHSIMRFVCAPQQGELNVTYPLRANDSSMYTAIFTLPTPLA
jgi:pyruvate/2-oxoacid:ferredoxin oxidoreductase beta subunit